MSKREKLIKKMAEIFKSTVSLKRKGHNYIVTFVDANGNSLNEINNPVCYSLDDEASVMHFGPVDETDSARDTFLIAKHGSGESNELGIKWDRHDEIKEIYTKVYTEKFEVELSIELSEKEPGKIETIRYSIAPQGKLVLVAKGYKCEPTPGYEEITKQLYIINANDKGVYPSSYIDELCGKPCPTKNERSICFESPIDENPILTVDDELSNIDIYVTIGSAKLSDPDGSILFQQKNVRNTIDNIEEALKAAIPGVMDFIRELVPEYKILTHKRYGIPLPQSAEIDGLDRYKLPSKEDIKKYIWVPKCLKRSGDIRGHLDQINEILNFINVSARMKDEKSDELVFSELDSNGTEPESRGNGVFKMQDGTLFRLSINKQIREDKAVDHEILLEVGKDGGKRKIKAVVNSNNEYTLLDTYINYPQVTAKIAVINDKSERDDCSIQEKVVFHVDGRVQVMRSAEYRKNKSDGSSFSEAKEAYAMVDGDVVTNSISANAKEESWSECIDKAVPCKICRMINNNSAKLSINGKQPIIESFGAAVEPDEEVVNLLRHPRINETIKTTEKVVESFFPGIMDTVRERVLPSYDEITCGSYSSSKIFDIFVSEYQQSPCGIPGQDILKKMIEFRKYNN